MNFRNPLVVAVPALLCGALLGYLVRPSAPATEPAGPEVKTERPTKKVKASGSDDAALNRLRARIQELERQLAAKEPPATEAKTGAAPTNRPPEGRRGGPGGWPRSAEEMRARFEEMKKNNPEQYAAMTNGWAQHRTRSLERAQGKLDILASVDASQLSPKQRAVHEQYQDLIARREELRDMMDLQNPDVTDEQRDAAMKEMHEIRQQMHKLAQTEREALLAHTATSFGVKGQAAKDLVDTVKAVYEATESWGGRGGRGGPPPGPPPDGRH